MVTKKESKAQEVLQDLLSDYKKTIESKIESRDKLSKEITELQENIAKIKVLINGFSGRDSKRDEVKVEAGDVGGLSVSDGAYHILKTAGKPLNCAVIGKLLKEGGKELKAKERNLYNMIYSILRRDARFIKAGPGTYGLAEWGDINARK